MENSEKNTLFPVFLKLEKINTLVIGGGNVAREKLEALLGNSPLARVKLVATEIQDSLKTYLELKGISYQERSFDISDLHEIKLAIIAINDKSVSKLIYDQCADHKILTNVADTPDYCDFYLGSIVQKGNLKIAISTNGKSPTIAKRIKEVLNETLPLELESVLDNMQKIRNSLSGDFSDKVKKLNSITTILAVDNPSKFNRKGIFYTILIIGAAFFLILMGVLLAGLIK